MYKIKSICIIAFKIMLIALLALIFNLLMMPKYIEENHDGRIIAEMYREELSPDVIFIGSSTVYFGVNPMIMYDNYGITSYVCASSSQPAWTSYYVLKEALNKFKPQMVVFDIGFLTIKDDYAEETSNRKVFDYMKPGYNKYKGVSEAMAAGESKWDYLFPVLRYHSRYNDLSMEDIKYLINKPAVTYNGFVMNFNQSAPLTEATPMELAENVSISPRSAMYLQKIITLCKDNGIDLMLMKTPSYNAKWGEIFENDITYIALANNLQYVNFDAYQYMMGIDWMQDSPDEGGHLNTFGSEKFSYYLGTIINDYYDVSDRREDAKYKKVWDKKVERYNSDKVNEIFGDTSGAN